MTDVTSTVRRVFMILAVCCWVIPAAAKPNPFLETSGPATKRSLSRTELRAPAALGNYSIQLPDGRTIDFKNVEVEKNSGVRTLRAKSKGSTLLLTTDGQHAYGYVLTDNEHYRIDTSDGDTIIVNVEALPDPATILGSVVDDAVVSYQKSGMQTGAANADAQDGPYVVDVAIFYDVAIADSESHQAARTYAQSSVDNVNAAFTMHSLDVQLRLVYVGELSVPLVGDPFSTFASNVDKHEIFSEFGADLGHYIYKWRPGHGYCGRANMPGRYGVSAIDCGSDTFPHEIGHNFGMNHDRAYAGYLNSPYNAYNYGYWCGGSTTLMTYGSPTLPFYSSPLQSFGGEACGVAIGEPGAAHNAEVANYTKIQTSGYVGEQTIYGDVGISTVGPLNVTEGIDGYATIEVTRTGDLSIETSVEVGMVGLEALPGEDFPDVVERLVFLPGESVKQFSVAILDDENFEPVTETFEIVIRYPNGLNITDASVTVMLSSDDPDRGIASFPTSYRYVDESAGTISIEVERVGPTEFPLSVNFKTVESSNYAVSGIDFEETSGQVHFGVGEAIANIFVTIIDDDLFEGNEEKRFWVHLFGDNVDANGYYHRIHIENDDIYHGQLRLSADAYFIKEGGGDFDVTIERLNGFENSHKFLLRAIEGTALSGIDYFFGSLGSSIWDNTESRTFRIGGVGDNAAVDGEKYFDLDLEPDWGGADPLQARVYIIDDDATNQGGGRLEVVASEVTTSEDAAYVDVAIQRVDGQTGAAVVGYFTSPNSAETDVDFVYGTGAVGWVDGDTTDKFVRIPIIDDSETELVESFDFIIGNAGGASIGANITTSVVITDNDGPGTLNFDASSYTLSEDGWVDIAVVRESGSIGAVGVSYQSVGGMAESDVDFVAVQGTLDWADGDDTSRAIRLVGVSDDEFEFHERFSVALYDPTGDVLLGQRNPTEVTIGTNDVPPYEAIFADISDSHWAWLYIQVLANSGITAGCGNGNYCPDSVVTRAQMAVFLERGMRGSGFSPPAATGSVFLDVSPVDFAASFIEQLASDGITAGCGNNNYCPDDTVTRDQMAVFLLRAKYGSSYSPPAAAGVFGDVDLGHWAVRWIEQLAAEGITAGCGGGNYCPNADVTRDQMAVFLVRAFGL